ncbi:MAG: RNA-guided endonuclease InsQ/TnpB family protein [Xenococcus sp. (in: cyanobacteria)]
MATRRYNFRLYPNKQQEKKLFSARRLHCYLYNACIAHRRYEWRKNQQSVDYFEQQNCLPEFKKEWFEFAELNSQTLQGTVKRVDLAYNSFFQGLRKLPKFKSIRQYSGWTYPGKSGYKVESNGKHGQLILRDLGITLRMRGQAKQWGKVTTVTIVYKPSINHWYASITVKIPPIDCQFGANSLLKYNSMVAFDLGTDTAITCYDGQEFIEIKNPHFTKVASAKIKQESQALRRKRAPNRKQKIQASNRWKKGRKKVSKLQRKVANQRQDWQHKVTSDLASRYDIGVTEKLNTKGMTRKAKKGSKRKKQKSGLNKSILSVGFGSLNSQIAYKIEAKGGLLLSLNTRKVKPSQRCPNCGVVHREWANLSNRYHLCNDCGFEIDRDRGSVMVMYNVATNEQQGLGTSLSNVDVFSSTSSTSKRKHTGSMKQLGQRKRQKPNTHVSGDSETPSVFTAG